jgi:hypothetical protein
MADIIVYDKISWHYPEGQNCPSLNAAKLHFVIVLEWLKKNNLLSDEGEEIIEVGIDADFSITSSMLNKKGNSILEKNYSDWLKSVDYSENIDLHLLDAGLRLYAGN